MPDEYLTAYRDMVKPADIILYGFRNSFISKLICFGQSIQTKDKKPSLWSHCAFAVDKETIIESTLDFRKFKDGHRLHNGVRYAKADIYADATEVMLMRLPISDKQRYKILEVADSKEKANITYPVLGLFGSLFSFWLIKWKSNPLQSKRSLYCSAFIQECVQEVLPDIDFDLQHTARNTSPEIISQFELPGLLKHRLR